MTATAIVPASEYKTEFTQGGVKAAISATGAKSGDLLMVPVDKLVVPAGFNVRIQNEAREKRIEEVCDSIMENGFYRHMPLKGYAGKEGDDTFIYVTGGFTRLEAAKRAIKKGAPIDTLPVILTPPGTSMADLMLGLANDNTGAPLKPYERGIVVKRLVGFGWDEKSIAEKMIVSENYVKDLLYLHSLPQPMQDMVVNDQVSAGHAVTMARKLGAAEALKKFRDELAKQKADAGPLKGSAPESVDQSGTAGRVRPRATRTAGATISKKLVFAAIDYAIALPGEGIEFLSRWRQGDKDAIAEVEATLVKTKKPKATKATKKPRQTKAAKAAAAAAKAAAAAGGKPATGKRKAGTAASAPAPQSTAMLTQEQAEEAAKAEINKAAGKSQAADDDIDL